MKPCLSTLLGAVFLASGISAQAEKVAFIKVTGTNSPRDGGASNIPGDLSAGERLPLETEQSRRLSEPLAGSINALLKDDGVRRCSLSASAPIHKQLLAALSPKARARISKLLASNLAKTDPGELPGHFERVVS